MAKFRRKCTGYCISCEGCVFWEPSYNSSNPICNYDPEMTDGVDCGFLDEELNYIFVEESSDDQRDCSE